MSLESLPNEGTSGFQGSLLASHVLSTHQGSPKDQNLTGAIHSVSPIYEEVSFLISHRNSTLSYFFLNRYVCALVHVVVTACASHDTCVGVRGQLKGRGSLLAIYRSQELDSGCHAWQQAPLSTEPSCWPSTLFCKQGPYCSIRRPGQRLGPLLSRQTHQPMRVLGLRKGVYLLTPAWVCVFPHSGGPR